MVETDDFKRLYQHPDRQTPGLDGRIVRFGIRHDMYSLGIVLLELAVWRQVQRIDDPELRRIMRQDIFNPQELHATLVQLVKRTLGGMLGSKYADAVLCCLQDTVSDQMEEREMRELFYERVLLPLKQIII